VKDEISKDGGGFDLYFTGFAENRIYKFFIVLLLSWFFIEKGIFPLVSHFSIKFRIYDLATVIDNLEFYLFKQNVWIPFWGSIFVGFILTPLWVSLVHHLKILYHYIRNIIVKNPF
jgi:hypothetical protein